MRIIQTIEGNVGRFGVSQKTADAMLREIEELNEIIRIQASEIHYLRDQANNASAV